MPGLNCARLVAALSATQRRSCRQMQCKRVALPAPCLVQPSPLFMGTLVRVISCELVYGPMNCGFVWRGTNQPTLDEATLPTVSPPACRARASSLRASHCARQLPRSHPAGVRTTRPEITRVLTAAHRLTGPLLCRSLVAASTSPPPTSWRRPAQQQRSGPGPRVTPMSRFR